MIMMVFPFELAEIEKSTHLPFVTRQMELLMFSYAFSYDCYCCNNYRAIVYLKISPRLPEISYRNHEIWLDVQLFRGNSKVV